MEARFVVTMKREKTFYNLKLLNTFGDILYLSPHRREDSMGSYKPVDDEFVAQVPFYLRPKHLESGNCNNK